MTCFAVCAPIRPRAAADSSSGIVSRRATSGFIRRAASIWIWSFGSSTLSTTVLRRKTLKAPVWTSTFTSMFSSAPYARLMARAMMSLTTSFERPFSAESCARPVTSSRFTTPSPSFCSAVSWRQKRWVAPPSRLERQAGTPCSPRRSVPNRHTREKRGPRDRVLRQVVADVREQGLELAAYEDHRDDDSDGDDGADEGVFDEALAGMRQNATEPSFPRFPCA